MAQRLNSQQEVKSNLSSDDIPEDQRYGYVIHDMNNADSKWKCILCDYIIKEPVQYTECGHRACRACSERNLSMTTEDDVICKECKVSTPRKAIMKDQAFKKEIDVLRIRCRYISSDCTWEGELKDYQIHLDKEHMLIPCSHCQEKFPSIQLLNDHQEKNCQRLFESCPLHADGCQEKILKKDLNSHFLTQLHQQAIITALTRIQDGRTLEQPDQSMEASSSSSSTIDNIIEQQTSSGLNELTEKVQKLNNDTIELSNYSVRLQENLQLTVQEINNLTSSIVDRRAVMSDLQPKQVNIQKEIESLKQTLEETHHISYDGTLTWRVDRVAERMADAQSERQTSIYSPVFYSSPSGYKMRARLYLHGDGNARRTHMSLFFLLMRGEHDSLLKWPFHYKVTFCLFDQTGANRHIIDSFRPDVKSNSFQRPKTDANIASGIPKFFPLPMIQQDDNPYVRDDTLFLKIVVDLTDTPKMMLPFILTLNPGLPYHVQQNLIKQETTRRQQQQTTTGSATSSTPVPANA